MAAPALTALTIAGVAHTGRMRSINEDCFLVSEIGGALRRGPDELVVERVGAEGGLVLGVFDGSGGRGREDDPGPIASRAIAERFTSGSASGPAALSALLVTAVTAAGDAVLAAATAQPALRGMGTTATVAAVRGADLVIAQVGDSRAYLLRRRELVQATRDDTLLNEAVRTGSATLDDASFFPYRKVLLQALGTGVAPKVGVTVVSACLGDVLLLCTDGVHGELDDAVLRATLLRHPEPGVAARVLFRQALASGGSDNLALVVARFDGEKLRPPAASDVVEDRGARPRA